MTDTTAKIRAKGLDTTGITESIAEDLFNKVGTHVMAIVDLRVVNRHGPDVKGKRGVELIIDGIEPALDDPTAEHLREIQRAIYLNRQDRADQLAIDQELGQERTTVDVLAAGAAFRPHPFLPAAAADGQPICDVCGHLEAAAVHSTQDVLPDPVDDEAAHDDEDLDEADVDEQEDDEEDDEEAVDQDAYQLDPFTVPTS